MTSKFIQVKYADNIETLSLGQGGSLTTEAIDDVLALTFVYPNCKIALTLSPIKGVDFRSVDTSTLIHAKDDTFSGLEGGKLYYAYVIEDGEEKAKYEEAQKKRAAAAATVSNIGNVKTGESCSCIEGNPCAISDNCKDWDNRIAVAAKVMDDKKRRK
jgi:hypothetical protein